MRINRDRLLLAIAKSGMSSKELEDKTALSNVTLSRIKNGANRPRPQTIYKIAKALNVEVEYLIKEAIE